MKTAIAPVQIANVSVVGQKAAELENLKKREEILKQEIETARQIELKELPNRLGFTDSAEFIRSLAAVHNVRGFSTNRAPARRKSAPQATTGRKPRTRITPELYDAIMKDLHTGKSKEYIMKRHDISAPSYQNLKRDAGLARPYARK